MPPEDEYDKMLKQIVLLAWLFAIVSVLIGVGFFVSGLCEIIND